MFTREELIKMVATGELNDTTILYDHNNIVLIKIASFKDCNELFSDWTWWCISKEARHWTSYCYGRNQYFLIDFNDLHSTNPTKLNRAAIGFTITDHNLLYAAHAKNDDNLLDLAVKRKKGLYTFESILKEKGLYEFVIEQNMNPKYADIDYLNIAPSKNGRLRSLFRHILSFLHRH